MMTTITTLISLIFLCTASAECEDGWKFYNDYLCIKTFPSTFMSYHDAKIFCASQGNDTSKSSLVTVKDAGMQERLVNSTNDIYDNLWIGGRYDDQVAQFVWDDGEPLTYTNWQEGSPRNDTTSNICIEMKPINGRLAYNPQGKWADVNCNKQNAVICQRAISWTLEDAVNKVIKMDKQLSEAEDERNVLRQQLEVVSSRVVPVGSIYIEYYTQTSPLSLWPDLTWQDVTSTYAGLFFRASGGGAGSWGATQSGCAPRISQVEFKQFTGTGNGDVTDSLILPGNGWSEYGRAGSFYSSGIQFTEGLRFLTDGCEMRPNNQAIRLWKRIA